MNDKYAALRLKNQLCFPLYAVSNLITRKYKPLLDELDLTYTQYIVMMVLWEEGRVNEKFLCEALCLKTNTLTPLLKKLEDKGYIKKEKDSEGNEVCYASFYTKTIPELEDEVSKKIHDAYTKLNVVVKALGCSKVYSDDGDELEPWGDDDKEKLTFPINKQLVEDPQYGYNTMRNIGQMEAMDLAISEYTEYGEEYRVVFVMT